MEQDINGVTDEIIDDLMRIPPLVRKKLLKSVSETLDKDMSHHHFIILKSLHESGTLPVSAIGRCVSLSKPEMTHFTDKLADLGLVDRQPDTSDRRIINLSLTDKGKQYLAEARKRIRNVIKEKLCRLEFEELKELAGILSRLKEIASKIE
jgi:DNA-binding MarR family transcriptional regulator